MTAPGSQLVLATNNGDIGGGEVMFLLIAQAARELGLDPQVVGPSRPGDVVAEAGARGFRTVAIPARDRKSYMWNLRRWDARERRGLLWCNGMVPGLATAGHGNRIVELHQPPYPRQRKALGLLRLRTRELVVTSETMAGWVPHTAVLDNWTTDLPVLARPARRDPVVLGFLGRFTREKGLHVLGDAVADIERRTPGRVRLEIGGADRYACEEDRRAIAEALAPIEHLVTRLGWVRPADFFARVDLVVVPSDCDEPFGLVAAESMAAGVPFVVSDAGAFPEVVGPAHPWVARQGSAEDLARVIERAIEAPVEQVQEVLGSLRRRWAERYSPSAGRARLADLLAGAGMQVER